MEKRVEELEKHTEDLEKHTEGMENRLSGLEERCLDYTSKLDAILKRQQIYTEEMGHFREHLMEVLKAKTVEDETIKSNLSTLQESFDNFNKDTYTKDHLEILCKRITSMNDKLALLDSFTWFIDATNKWRTQLFLGVLKIAAFIIFIYMLAHVDAMKKALKFIGIGG